MKLADFGSFLSISSKFPHFPRHFSYTQIFNIRGWIPSSPGDLFGFKPFSLFLTADSVIMILDRKEPKDFSPGLISGTLFKFSLVKTLEKRVILNEAFVTTLTISCDNIIALKRGIIFKTIFNLYLSPKCSIWSKYVSVLYIVVDLWVKKSTDGHFFVWRQPYIDLPRVISP